MASERRPDVVFGAMTEDERDTLVGWAAGEGWNPGRHDIGVAWTAQREAFVAARHSDGAMIGGGAVMSYDGVWGWMGLFIMRPDLRGQGIGRQLWFHRRDLLLERLAHADSTIGMDGVFAMQDFYARGGFRLAYRNLRYEGSVSGAASGGEHAVAPCDIVEGASLDETDLSRLVEFDEQHNVGPRRGLMAGWFRQPGARIAVVEGAGGSLRAMAMIRPCRVGWKFGPVVANDADVAERVVTGLARSVAGEQVQIDVPEPNAVGLDLVRGLGLREAFGCARMYHGRVPELPVDRLYGVTSFEFG